MPVQNVGGTAGPQSVTTVTKASSPRATGRPRHGPRRSDLTLKRAALSLTADEGVRGGDDVLGRVSIAVGVLLIQHGIARRLIRQEFGRRG